MAGPHAARTREELDEALAVALAELLVRATRAEWAKGTAEPDRPDERLEDRPQAGGTRSGRAA